MGEAKRKRDKMTDAEKMTQELTRRLADKGLPPEGLHSPPRRNEDIVMTKNKNENFLEGFSDIIRRQGEEQRRREDERLKAMKAGLPEQKDKITRMSDLDLVENLTEQRRYESDPRFTELWEDLFQHTKAELIRRLLNK